MSLPNKSVDLKFSANDAFLEKPSSGTLTIQRLESQFKQFIVLGAIKPQCLNTVAKID